MSDLLLAAPTPARKPPPPEWRPNGPTRAMFLLGPIVVSVGVWFVVRDVAGSSYANQMLVAAGACVLGLGTAVVLGPSVLSGVSDLTTWDLAWMVMYLNTATALFYSYNLNLLHRLPWVGPKLRAARRNAVVTLHERPWIRRWATFGVGFFVLLPLPGSGSFGGCVVARLVGLSRHRSFVTVALAGAVVCLVYAWFGGKLEAWGKDNPIGLPLKIGALVVLLVLLWLVGRWVTHLSRNPHPSTGHGAGVTPE